MASNVLKSFLIGIGYDTKALEAGDKKINASLSGIKSGALSISAALVGVFGASASAIVGVADRVDKLAMSTQNLRTSQAAVYNFGNAVKLMGGDAADALDTLKRFEEIQNDYNLKGEIGPLNELALAGIDTNSLYRETRTGEEFMRNLAGQLPRLNEGQRSQVQNSLGLSDGVFKSLVGGVEQLDATLKEADGLTGSVDQLTDDARALAKNAAVFGQLIEGIKNELAEGFLPSLVGAGSALNDFLKEHRGNIAEAIDYAADNAGATAALGGSAAAALTGAAAAKLGLGIVGGAVSKAGTAGVAVTGGAIGANVINRTLDENVPGYGEASRSFDELLKSVTGLDRIKGPMELLFGGESPTYSAPRPAMDGPETYGGQVIRTQEDIDYLNHRDRSAADSLPPAAGLTPEEDRKASAEAIAGALSRVPFKVENQLGLTVQLDGQALETKIMQVNERQNYETLGDLRTTTER